MSNLKREKNKFFSHQIQKSDMKVAGLDRHVNYVCLCSKRFLKVRQRQNKSCAVSIYSQNKVNKINNILAKLCKYSICNYWVVESTLHLMHYVSIHVDSQGKTKSFVYIYTFFQMEKMHITM